MKNFQNEFIHPPPPSLEPGIYNSRSPIRKRSASFRKISKQKRIEGKARSDMVRKRKCIGDHNIIL